MKRKKIFCRRRGDPLKSRLCYVVLFTTTRVTVNETTRKQSKKIYYAIIIPDFIIKLAFITIKFIAVWYLCVVRSPAA